MSQRTKGRICLVVLVVGGWAALTFGHPASEPSGPPVECVETWGPGGASCE